MMFRCLALILSLEILSTPVAMGKKSKMSKSKKSSSGGPGMGDHFKNQLGENPCAGADPGIPNLPCFDDLGEVNPGLSLGGSGGEQAAADVTVGYIGLLEVDYDPIVTDFYTNGMCAANVHWHIGAEHRSEGQFDENGVGPHTFTDGGHRNLAEGGELQEGFRCHHYDPSDKKFTKPYDWKYCHNMEVGETYEVHWPSSNLAMCGTVWQYQYPFKDGILCRLGEIGLENAKIGVHAQVFTIVNDEDYYFPDLIKGMIKGVGGYGKHITKYTGSTTGQSVNNDDSCSGYTVATWQVDRNCHLISASSFDKMCMDMLAQADDMTLDVEPHGSRELVIDELTANNQVNRKDF